MKLKTFFAPSVPEAMQEIRDLYPDNAVIVSATKIDKGVKLIIALQENVSQEDLFTALTDERIDSRKNFFSTLLTHQAFEDVFIQRLVQASLKKGTKVAQEKLLSHAFSELYSFKPLYPILKNAIYVLTGNAGSGKTLLAKKMAFQAKKEGLKTALVTLDTIKSGAVSDLKQFAQMLKIPITVTQNIKDLNESLTMMRLSADYILVDTPSINPYKQTDLEKLKFMRSQLMDAEFVLTMPAGLDAQEAVSEGALFYKHGCTSLIATKLDCAVRYYNLFKTTVYNQLSWSAFSFSENITHPPVEATAQNLATLLTVPLTQQYETTL